MFDQINPAGPRLQKWGGVASFGMAAAAAASSYIYLTGDLRAASGPFAYSLADILSGPVWGAALVTAVLALRDRGGGAAPRRMNLALLAAFAAACAFVAVASIRSANRHYHLIHPELALESSVEVLTAWTTLVAGVSGAAWHFLGWALALTASAGWTSGSIPRLLAALYGLAAASALLAFLLPEMEANASALTVIAAVWQGFILIKPLPGETTSSG